MIVYTQKSMLIHSYKYMHTHTEAHSINKQAKDNFLHMILTLSPYTGQYIDH